jgi:tRNA A58 N-methylase Trm61
MEMNYEVAKERLRAGFERQFEKEMTQLTDELNQKEDEIWKLKQEILDMKEDIKLIDKMKELLKQYALYSEIEYDEQSLTLKL